MILVTGGTGLLGSHLLCELAQHEARIRAIYRTKERIEQVSKIFTHYFGDASTAHFAKIEWVKGDVNDLVSLEDALEGVKYVYHCAAIVSFRKRDFNRMIKVNVEGTRNLVNLSLKRGVKKFAHVSSTAAIGGQENTFITEKTKWKYSNHNSGYAISKYNAEREVWRAAEEDLDVVLINPCVIFGAGNWSESSLTIFRTMKNGLKFYTDGENAIVDARDVASILRQLMNSPITNERFLCIGENLPFKTIQEKIAKQLGVTSPSIKAPPWLMGIAWRIIGIFCAITGKAPTITRETARSAYSKMTYSNDKVCAQLNVQFKKADEMIKNVTAGQLH